MTDAVFGYGSLVADLDAGRPAVLHAARRAWTVAMDNTIDLPGYKHYLTPEGHRPAVAVAFLDLRADEGDVEGVLLPVTPPQLDALDRRERQYGRVDITGRVSGAAGRVWTYVGRPDARDRAAQTRAAGTLVVARTYLATVLAGFDARGPDARARFDATTDAVDVPVRNLRRVENPP